MGSYVSNREKYLFGVRKGMPIAFGYVPVSFTFGLMAVNGGIPVWLAVFISLTNLTSAGQFGGTNLIIAGAGYFEIVLTVFVINIRYMMMSLSLSQKIEEKTTLLQRLVVGFGITDETFVVASMEPGKVSFHYLLGLITGPIAGWTLGTAGGAIISSLLPEALGGAMGIALYAMFIAIIIPPSKKSGPVLMIVLISVAINMILKYVPLFSFISDGFRVITATILGAGIGAALWPSQEDAAEQR